MNQAIVFLFTKYNQYSVNALAAAIEKASLEVELKTEVFFIKNPAKLLFWVKENASHYDRLFIALSFISYYQDQILNLSRDIKQLEKSNLAIIAGGPDVSVRYRYWLERHIDIAVLGEGEKTLIDLLTYDGKVKSLQAIAGIAYHDAEGQIIKGPARAPINLNDFDSISGRYGRYGSLELSRGCPFGCFFCQSSYYWGKQMRHRSLENILRQVSLIRKAGLRDIFFTSPNAMGYGAKPEELTSQNTLAEKKSINKSQLLAQPAKVAQLLSEVRREISSHGRIFFGIFPTELRPEHISAQTLEIIQRYADNRRLAIGAQSGSDRLLKKCHRGHSVDDIIAAAILSRQFGFQAHFDFIFGLPGEEQNDIDQTLALITSLSKLGSRSNVHFFTPLIGTPFEHRQPGKITAALRQKLHELSEKGIVYGNWQQQCQLKDSKFSAKTRYN